ncbi:reprolysin-like metallopeptidase [Luteibacter sp. 329MFSha]|uniref:reprolysin-like metallopeptidase n=1 Tax=Luteibacter sp. 329MFSha TaxID=1798239 RepID=UPI0008AAB6D2|nr:zinc-dependent metalloprotease family protein [Luteibacter sp. 329MFSha]SEW20327.1 Metallo-peptidase family M12B Reprolysin-like [Luteibacter sp. 329MFSha]
MRLKTTLSFAIAACLGTASMSATAASLWRDGPTVSTTAARAADTDMPSRYRSVILDRAGLAATRSARGAAPARLELPLPDGGQTVFELEDANVLPASLAAKYPNLRSLKGKDAAGRQVRLDIARDGVHAIVRDEAGDWMLRPESAGGSRAKGADRHIVFRRADAPMSTWTENAGIGSAATIAPGAAPFRRGAAPEGTPVLRTFRLAMTATSSYTAKMGGTIEDGLAGIVRTVNRVNAIFENDLGVHFVLAENNDRLVFPNKALDPFELAAPGAGLSDFDAANMNVLVTREKLGEDAFDVGHLLDGRRDAGVAGQIGNTCMPWSGDEARLHQAKAAGMTGSAHPFGDAFHVDFVAHELGHQFGAHHTFNGCTGDHEDTDSNVEPGSGSTIMGYAGICPRNNLQAHSDPYFHAASIEQIGTWLDGIGGECAATRPNTAPVPVIDTTGWNKPVLVPAQTPLRLQAVASFADPRANITYTFEQMDRGPLQPADEDLVDLRRGALFRSRPPQARGEQTFPAMDVLLGNEPAGLGDALPQYDRNLHFRLTARDNRDHRSHVVSADRTVRVVDTGEAFAIEAPAAGTVLRRGKARQVRWNVAGTAVAPIGCPKVDIDLSVDGGKTFLATPLAVAVANKGRATVTLPAEMTPTRNARLRVECADGRFFALSPEIEIR